MPVPSNNYSQARASQLSRTCLGHVLLCPRAGTPPMSPLSDLCCLQARLALALSRLADAAAAGANLALLPEEFAGAGGPVEGDFPSDWITTALAAAARKHRMYVAFGMRVRGTAADDKIFSDLGQLGFNTAIILDKTTGDVVGEYRKQWHAT